MAHAPVLESGSRSDDDTVSCPLCEQAAATETGIYIHLQTSHRKSNLANELLETSPADADSA